MKRFPLSLSLVLTGIFALELGSVAQAQYANGQAATYIIGQSTFSIPAPTPVPVPTPDPTDSTVLGPQGIAVDNTTGKIFIADSLNNRVLRFSSAATFANGASAEAVFGQASFFEREPGTTAATMDDPNGVWVDSLGNLWVADTGNNRVLLFTSAATADSSADADGVLGQPNLDSGDAATSDRGLSEPYALTSGSDGTLYIAERGNNRVLRFGNAVSAALNTPSPNGPPANGLFGQSNYLSSAPGVSAASFDNPSGVALDASGNLWVTDTNNNRVLRFANAASAPNASSASVVFGQTSFTTKVPGTSSSQFQFPSGLTFDSIGRLYVGDFSNNRVLIFSSTSLSTNGSAASLVLGQPNFSTSGILPVTASSLNNPFGIGYLTSGYLWVADRTNNRLLSYAIQPGTPSLSVSPANPKIKVGTTKNVTLQFRNTSVNSDVFVLKIGTQKNFSKRGRVSYLVDGVNVTSSLVAGTYQTPELPSGQGVKIVMQIRPLKGSTGKLNFTATATSVTKSSQTTLRKISVKILPPK